MSLNIFHHFEISSKILGLNSLMIGQIKSLILFTIFSIAVYYFKPFQYFFAWLVDIVENLLKSIMGPIYKNHFHFFMILFLFIMMGNLYGLLPHAFAFNGHIIVTMTWALIVFGYGLIRGLMKPINFIHNFLPHGAPWPFILFITPLKLLSFCLSPISMALRLFINVLIGHVMMTIFEIFSEGGLISQTSSLFAIIGFSIMELGVSLLQSYIFLIASINLVKTAVKIHE